VFNPTNGTYGSLNATAAQLKNCPFRVNTIIELKTVTNTSSSNNNNKQQNTIKVNTLRAVPK
jgi:hypothetical protein